jgi:hypothetical protein
MYITGRKTQGPSAENIFRETGEVSLKTSGSNMGELKQTQCYK